MGDRKPLPMLGSDGVPWCSLKCDQFLAHYRSNRLTGTCRISLLEVNHGGRSLCLPAVSAKCRDVDRLEKRVAVLEGALETTRNALANIFEAVDMGWWELCHTEDEDCPEDDTCECNCTGTASLASDAMHAAEAVLHDTEGGRDG